jgi:hypothetical protein
VVRSWEAHNGLSNSSSFGSRVGMMLIKSSDRGLQRARQEYNIVLLHPDDGSVESWTAEGSAEKMRVEFKGWEPRSASLTSRFSLSPLICRMAISHRIKKLLEMVPYTLKWKLMDRKPLDTWIHPAGKVVLLGDACHPMLVGDSCWRSARGKANDNRSLQPYRAQGAGMAVRRSCPKSL